MMQIEETVKGLQQHAANFVHSTYVLARWAIEVPELEAKILFGRHLYLDVVAVELLQRRLSELSVDWMPHNAFSQTPALKINNASTTAARLVSFYRNFKPELIIALATHARQASILVDEPSVLLLEALIRDQRRAIEEANNLSRLLADIFAGFASEGPREGALIEVGEPFDAEHLKQGAPTRPARDTRFNEHGPPGLVGDGINFDREQIIALMHMNLTDLEIPSIEACARLILDFREMPWQFVLDMSRQAWDESRHAEAFRRQILEMGGKLGAFGISHALWDMATDQSLEVRLGLHQRIGEWIGVDGAFWHAKKFAESHKENLASLFDFVARDEITHVAFGNKWINFLVGSTASAVEEVHKLALARRADFGKHEDGPLIFPLNEEACQRAGFTQPKLGELVEQYRKHGSRLT
jgi:uncharacterized ferritin-like protein (DUF455 family)